MRDLSDIRELLNELDQQPADELEDHDLDFKEWNTRSISDAVAIVIEMAIWMANGGGGTVVFGVNDKAVGRDNAILGVPPEVDVNRLKKPDLHHLLSPPGHPERNRRIDWEAAKTRVLSVLKQRAKREEPGLSNAEIRQITHMDRHQVVRLMRELRQENPEISAPGRGPGARYKWKPMQ